MAKNLERILVVDVEATCWEHETVGDPHKVNEIIQIGVSQVQVLHNGRPHPELPVTKIDNIFVKPIMSEVSEFCTQLTGITQKHLDKHGITYPQAVARLKKHGSRSLAWMSWGDYDRTMFHNMNKIWVSGGGDLYPFGNTHTNLKNLFSLVFGLPKEYGLKTAMDMLGLEFKGNQHDGADDAYNTARILSRVIRATQHRQGGAIKCSTTSSVQKAANP